MDSTPQISIIIPTHNRRQLLEETLESVKSQNINNWECIVIDDASSDDTWVYLQDLNDKRFKCFHFAESQERSRARNHGLKHARGKYVLFLDDDDLLLEDTLQLHFNGLESNPHAFCSIGSSQLFWPDGKTEDWIATTKTGCKSITSELIFGWIPVSGQCLFRKENVNDIGGWNIDMNYAEDHEFMLRLADNHSAFIMSDCVQLYRCHGQPRPDDLHETMTQLRKDYIATLPEEKRNAALKTLTARAIREDAEQAYEDARMFLSIRLYLKILFLSPGLYFSPVTRKDLLPALLKSFLGGPVIRAGRAIKSIIK